jgi:hypothetical protein
MARTETLRPEESLLPLLLLFCVAAAASAAGITDGGISDAVDEELPMDPAIPETFEIDVAVEDGRVYQNGVVDSYFDKSRADQVEGAPDYLRP